MIDFTLNDEIEDACKIDGISLPLRLVLARKQTDGEEYQLEARVFCSEEDVGSDDYIHSEVVMSGLKRSLALELESLRNIHFDLFWAKTHYRIERL